MSQSQEQQGTSSTEKYKAGLTTAKIAATIVKKGVGTLFGGPLIWAGGGLTAVAFFIVFPIFIVIIIGLGLGGGEISLGGPPPVDAAPSPGDGTGLINNTYCEIIRTLQDGSCSIKLEFLFEAAADWSKIPAGILVGVSAKECPYPYFLTNTQVDQFSQPGAEVPHDAQGDGPDFDDGCPDSSANAHGPMQFSLSTWRQNGKYHNAYNLANSTNRITDLHNLAESIFGAAWYLKCLQITHTADTSEYRTACDSGDFSGIPFDLRNDGPDDTTQKLEEDDIFQALASYHGNATPQGCIDDGYCTDIYFIYTQTADFGATGGTSGWPVSGLISQVPYACRPSHCPGGRHASAIDIDDPRGTKIYSTTDGNYRGHGTDPRGNLWVRIETGDRLYYYIHLDSFSNCVRNKAHGEFFSQGELVGYMGDSGVSGHVHLHYSIRTLDEQSISLEEVNNTLPNYELHGNVTSSYTGSDC